MPILSSLALGSVRGFGFAGGGLFVEGFVVVIGSSQTWTCPEGVTEVEYLVLSGGGGGGSGYGGAPLNTDQDTATAWSAGGGGGAGGIRLGSSLPVSAGTSYNIIVGAGGRGGTNPFVLAGPSSLLTASGGGTGSNSEIVTLIATNGGGGGGYAGSTSPVPQQGGDGGCGGGSAGNRAPGPTFYNTPRSGGNIGAYTSITGSNIISGSPAPLYAFQGNNGGVRRGQTDDIAGGFSNGGAGGGGGTAEAGFDGLDSQQASGARNSPTSPYAPITGNYRPGDGGNGLASAISGHTVFYGDGGGGGGIYYPLAPFSVNRTAGRGGGHPLKGGGNGGYGTTPGHSGQTERNGKDADVGLGGGGGGGAIYQGPATDPRMNRPGGGGSGAGGVVILKYSTAIVDAAQSFAATTQYTIPKGVKKADYFIIGGGGGGGGGYFGGGGGAGGVRLGTDYPLTPEAVYTISVGAGGVGAYAQPNFPGLPSESSTNPEGSAGYGGNGGGSFIQSSTTHLGANGGGGGSSSFLSGGAVVPMFGGSGGGGTTTAIGGKSLTLTSANGHSYPVTGENISRGSTVQGFNGGSGSGSYPSTSAGGGGGGAAGDGHAGHPVDGSLSCNGGNAIVISLRGSTEYFGGGGGGGHGYPNAGPTGTSGQPGIGGNSTDSTIKAGAGDGGVSSGAPGAGVTGTAALQSTGSGGGGVGGTAKNTAGGGATPTVPVIASGNHGGSGLVILSLKG